VNQSVTDARARKGNHQHIDASDKINTGGIDNARSLGIDDRCWCSGVAGLGSFVGWAGLTLITVRTILPNW
jgi:hypothetical protein